MPTRSAHARAVPLLAVTALAAGVLVPAAPAVADPGNWSAAPTSGDDTGRDDGRRKEFYLEGASGTVLSDTVSVVNSGRAEGRFTLRGSGGTARWTALADKEVRVPARTRAEVPFTVTVPEGTPPGARRGKLLVRSEEAGERSLGVQVRVAGPRMAELSVEDVALHTGDRPRVDYTLVNRGTTTLVPRVTLRTGDAEAEPVAAGLPPSLAPGERAELHAAWKDAPVLGSADVTVAARAADGAHDSGTASYTAVPGAAVLLVLLAGLGTGGGWYLRRRRAADRGAPPDEGEPTGETRELTGAAK